MYKRDGMNPNPITTAITPESIGANARCMYTAQGELTCMAGNATTDNQMSAMEKFTANFLHAEIPAWMPGNDPSARYLKSSSNVPPTQTQPSVPAPSSGGWPYHNESPGWLPGQRTTT